MYDIKIGSSTNSLYYFGHSLIPSNPNFIMLMKVDSSDTIVWSKVYDKTVYHFVFELDSSETYIYLVHRDPSAFPLSQISTTSGSLTSTFQLSSITSSFAYTDTKFLPSSNILFLTARSIISSLRAAVCHTNMSSFTSAQCAVFSNLNYARSILPLTQNDMLFVAKGISFPNSIYLER